jgi:hypothetical protein
MISSGELAFAFPHCILRGHRVRLLLSEAGAYCFHHVVDFIKAR